VKKAMAIGLVFMLLLSCISYKGPSPNIEGPSLKDMQENLVETRPNWKGQLNLEELVPGIFVLEVYKDSSEEALILSSPYEEEGLCVYDRVIYKEGEPWGYLTTAYCSDFGLVEYSGRLHGWNKYNHLVLSGRESLSQERVEILRNNLQPDPEKPPEIKWIDPRIHLL
jgi:hypothetical protein